MDHQDEHTTRGTTEAVEEIVLQKPIITSSKKEKALPIKEAKEKSSHVPEAIKRQSDKTVDSKLSTTKSLPNLKPGKIDPENVFVENVQRLPVSSDLQTDKKKGRLRKKAFLKAVLDQMEFYFSDCNLRKDRYLRQLYDSSEDGYVDLTVFGNFNKLQSMHKDGVSLNILRKALGKSTLLQLNGADTKVKRCHPLVDLDPEEIDKRTVYVEYLPKHANHAWLEKIFSQCGKVCYVSLPTYRTSKQLKGFAFVEFQSREEADRACSMLNNPPPARIDEKPGKFPKGNKTLSRLQRIVPGKADEEENEENTSMEVKEEQDNLSTAIKRKKKKKSKKRRASESGSEESSEKKDSKQAGCQEGKKKKKKKKKRQAVGTDPLLNSEEESFVKENLSNFEEKTKSNDQLERDIKIEGSSVNKTEVDESLAKEDKEVMKEDMEREGMNKEIDEVNNKRKRKRNKRKKSELQTTEEDISTDKFDKGTIENKIDTTKALSARMEKKRKRQEDIRRKREALQQSKEKEIVSEETESNTSLTKHGSLKRKHDTDTLVSLDSDEPPKVKRKNEDFVEIAVQKISDRDNTETENGTYPAKSISRKRKHESDTSDGTEFKEPAVVRRKSDGSELMSCLVKCKKQAVQKKVEFDPVLITTEFIKRKEVRRRKKVKRDSLHLRVITKEEWLGLKTEFIDKQKSHMSALKKSLRELRQQEEQNRLPDEAKGKKHVDLTDVFGTKRLKPTLDIKLAHLEKLKFVPNAIVQWKCSHEMSRQKIRDMFKDVSADSIDYIEAEVEAKSGYIRFKDEKNAEKFAKLSRLSPSFSARVLPESQQASYWEKANRDRIAKLSRKRCERGSERIARKVFERNKAMFHQKPSHVVFDDDEKQETAAENKMENIEKKALAAEDEIEEKVKDISSNAMG